MKKVFVLDTNVLILDPFCIYKFEDNDVVIPIYVLEELDKHKTRNDEVGKNARQSTRELDSLRETGNLHDGIELEDGGTISVYVAKDLEKYDFMDMSIMDNKIVACALEINKSYKDTFLVTNDINLRVRADSLELKSEKYESNRTDISFDEDGTIEFVVSGEIIDSFYKNKGIDLVEDSDLNPNEMVILTSDDYQVQSALGRVSTDGTRIQMLSNFNCGLWGIKPKNKEQKHALDILMDDEVKLVTLAGKAGTGKAQPLDAPVLTSDGWRPMGAIEVGMKVATVDGSFTEVTGTFPQGKKEIYRVYFTDGTSTECCKEHLWFTKTQLDRDYKRSGSVKNLEEIMKSLRYGKQNKRNHSIPIAEPVQFSKKDLKIDPYVMGILLGDGTFRHNLALSTGDIKIVNDIKNILGSNYSLNQTNGQEYYYSICYNKHGENPLKDELVNLGLWMKKSEEKFIPEDYLYSSIEDRINLIRGLMDSDGETDGSWTGFTTTSRKLSDDFRTLVQSLGGTAKTKERKTSYTYKKIKKKGLLSYRTTVVLDNNINPFKLERKGNAVKQRTKYLPRRYIDCIEFVGEKEAKCISVAHESHLYLTNDFIVTHNSLMTLAAGLHQVTEENKYSRLLISRAVIPVGKEIGFLPGPQPLDAKVLTPTGWTTMGELNTGDYVVAHDGSHVKVLQTFDKGVKDVYKISTNDCRSTEACEDHLWLTFDYEERKRQKKGSVRSTKEIYQNLYHKSGKLNFSIPRCEPLDFEKQDFIISPYTLGVLLGDGSLGDSITLTVSDEEIVTRVNSEINNLNMRCNYAGGIAYRLVMSDKESNKPAKSIKITNVITGESSSFDRVGIASKVLSIDKATLNYRCINKCTINNLYYEFVDDRDEFTNKIKNELNNLNLLKLNHLQKFIPNKYLFASIEQRVALLQGLMDTDGSVNKKSGELSFTTTSKSLANGVRELTLSLGGRCTLRSRDRIGKSSKCGDKIITAKHISYEFTLSLPEEIDPFFLKRKLDLYRQCLLLKTNERKRFIHHSKIESIEFSRRAECRCILIDHPDHLYITDDYIVTHNTEQEKLDPWMRAIWDNLEFMLNSDKKIKKMSDSGRYKSYQYLIDSEIIKVEAISFMRGRSIANQFILIDEAQNLSVHEVRTILTRAGEGTKIVLAGDPSQVDNPYLDSENNGLSHVIQKMTGESIYGHITLHKGERSALAELAAQLL